MGMFQTGVAFLVVFVILFPGLGNKAKRPEQARKPEVSYPAVPPAKATMVPPAQSRNDGGEPVTSPPAATEVWEPGSELFTLGNPQSKQVVADSPGEQLVLIGPLPLEKLIPSSAFAPVSGSGGFSSESQDGKEMLEKLKSLEVYLIDKKVVGRRGDVFSSNPDWFPKVVVASGLSSRSANSGIILTVVNLPVGCHVDETSTQGRRCWGSLGDAAPADFTRRRVRIRIFKLGGARPGFADTNASILGAASLCGQEELEPLFHTDIISYTPDGRWQTNPGESGYNLFELTPEQMPDEPLNVNCLPGPH